MNACKILLLVLAAILAVPGCAQVSAAGSQPADNMQVLRGKLKADQKLVVAANMGLTEGEAKGFWPLDVEYQRELQEINDRLAMIIVAYAREYGARPLAVTAVQLEG